MPRPIRLIATDLDGTLDGNGCAITRYQDFAERLERYHERYGAAWVVCTGRSLHSFESVLKPLETLGISPDYVIVHHAYIYKRGRRGYWPHLFWNTAIRFQVWASSLYLRGALNEWLQMVKGMNDHVTTVFHRRNRLCLRFRTEESAEAAAELLRKKAAVFKHLRVFHYLLEVDVRTVPFTKGMALTELAQRLGIGNAEILAIGNGHNDISMLNGEAAGATGCPVNAEVDVMETVHRSGGHIARSRGLDGVIEILDAWLGDAVSSELPAWWTPNKQQKNPKSMGRRMNHPGRHHHTPAPRAALWVGILSAYTVLVVFASFGLVPFSGLIMKPFTMVAGLVERLIEILGLSVGISKDWDHMRIGLIGGGKMAEALISGMLAKTVCTVDDLLVSDLDPGRRQRLHGQYGVETLEQNRTVAERSDVVILAVKPQHLDPVLAELAPVAVGRLFVSIAAGRRLSTFEQRLPGARVVRVMPNLPFQAGEGMSVFCRGVDATEADVRLVRQILESGGRVLEMDESFFDFVTALSGSAPAFFAFVVQAFVKTAGAYGMASDTALQLALQTMRGTAAIMMQDGISPAELMVNVASKGGTTAAGLAVLENSDVSAVLQATLDAAARRSAELSA